jgi:hypothetical protein
VAQQLLDLVRLLDRYRHPDRIDARLDLKKWGRCYDHSFRRFSTIFGVKIGVFLKNQC